MVPTIYSIGLGLIVAGLLFMIAVSHQFLLKYTAWGVRVVFMVFGFLVGNLIANGVQLSDITKGPGLNSKRIVRGLFITFGILLCLGGLILLAVSFRMNP